jgi:hypothetical protein
MKPLYSLFIILLVMLSLTSCKEKYTPFEKPASAMYFQGTVNGREKALIEEQNGFRFKSEDSCVTLSNGAAFYTYSLLFQGSSDYHMSNRECFGLNFHNIFFTAPMDPETAIQKYFTTPMPLMYIDSVTGLTGLNDYGVEVIWTDGQGDTYTTLHTPQTSNFQFESFSMTFGAFGRSLRFEGKVSCLLYCKEKRRFSTINDGNTRFVAVTNCY